MVWVLFALAVLTRLWFLGNKPIHFDESINGWFVLQLQKSGFYVYDPSNFHGPLYFYLLDIWVRCWGASVETLRSLPALFSIALVMLFWRVSRWMCLFLLLSPIFVFYGRSGIHESVFVFFQALFFLGLWNFRRAQKNTQLFLALFGLWGMLCLKETFVLTFATVIAGLVAGGFPWKKLLGQVRELWLPILFFIAAWALLFSGFGHHPQGMRDFFTAFTPWLKTGAEGAGHEKGFFYWLQLMTSTEPLLLLAVASAVAGLFRPWRAVAVFALLQLLIYSWIPYKTPWCAVTIAWPLYFCLAFFCEDSWPRSSFTMKSAAVAVFLAAFSFHGVQLWRSSYREPIDLNHPLVYVNSTYEFKDLNRKIVSELERNPSRRDEIIQISLAESWPLPWTLQLSRGLRYDHVRKKIHSGAWIYFCDAFDDNVLRSQLGEGLKKYHRLSLSIRQNTPAVSVWWRED